MPEVSVLIPAFRPDYLDACIASVLAQTFSDIEILIGDDSDGDQVESVVQKWDDRRIRYGRNPRRQEPGANRDFLLAEASGRYVKFAFDDDLLLPGSIEVLHAAATSTGAALAFHGRYVADERGCVLSDAMALPKGQVVNVTPTMLFEQLIGNLFNFVGEPTSILVDLDVLRSIDQPFGFSGHRLRFLTDVALYTNLARRGHSLVGLGYLGSVFRLHGTQTSNQNAPGFSAGLFEWELFARWSADNGHLDRALLASILTELRGRYRTHLSSFPELAAILAIDTAPDDSGHYFHDEFRRVLEAGWCCIDDRRRSKASAA